MAQTLDFYINWLFHRASWNRQCLKGAFYFRIPYLFTTFSKEIFLMSNCWRLILTLKNNFFPNRKSSLSTPSKVVGFLVVGGKHTFCSPPSCLSPSSCQSTATSPAVDWSMDVTTAVVKCLGNDSLVKILRKKSGKCQHLHVSRDWILSGDRFIWRKKLSEEMFWDDSHGYIVRFCWVRWLETSLVPRVIQNSGMPRTIGTPAVMYSLSLFGYIPLRSFEVPLFWNNPSERRLICTNSEQYRECTNTICWQFVPSRTFTPWKINMVHLKITQKIQGKSSEPNPNFHDFGYPC